jgi:hypothetical protein
MRRILHLIIISFPLLANAQKKTIFKDNFTSNKHKWQLANDSNFNVAINLGVLHVEKFEKNRIRNGCLWLRKQIPNFTTDKDFKITFSARILNYDEGGSPIIDFQWGQMNEIGDCKYFQCDSLYQINIRANGSIRLDYFRKGWQGYIPWTDSIATQKSAYKNLNDKTKIGYSKYEIIQKLDMVYLKRNDKTLFSRKIKLIKGNSIGIQQCLKCTWEITKLVIRQN